MADKNQQRFLNGTPPQFNATDLNQSYMQQTQSNLMATQVPEQNSYSHLMQKRSGLMVNGQVSTSGRNSNMYLHSGPLPSGLGDMNESRIPNPMRSSSQSKDGSPSSGHINLAAGMLSGSQFPRMSYNSQPSGPAQFMTSAAQVGKSDSQRSPFYSNSVQSNVQFNQIQQPSPQLGNRSIVAPSGNSHLNTILKAVPQSEHTERPSTVQQQYQQKHQQHLPPLQASFSSPFGIPPTSQRLPTNELPSTDPPSCDSSPYNKPPLANVSSIQDINSSPLHPIAGQGSQASPPFPSCTQSFPSQSGVQTNRYPSVSHGYQPVCTPAGQPPLVPLSNVAGSAPAQDYNQLTPNRTMPGAPPTSMGNSKYPSVNSLTQGMDRMSITKHGFNRMWGLETIDLLQCRNILPPQKVTPPPIRLNQEFMDNVNCSSEIFCCTMNKIPETNSLLQKSRLPLGILIHPFRDLNQLAIIQCSSIVRCRACRTYINPFVYFVDNKRWKCNLCFRINELPDEFQYDPVSKTYGDPSRRPEVRNSTIEFIAPSEYMLRPPQPAIYLFVLDVSRTGCDCGYLETLCSVLLDELDNLPGDCRTQIGFILFDSYVHFFSIAENYTQAHEMIVTDINDVFLPTSDSLLVNLNENKQLVRDLLQELPRKYAESFDTGSALGAALQAGYKLMAPTGGRITVFQSCLPNIGPGNLNSREDPNQRSAKDVRHLGPQTDFYKRLSLDCSTQQISVDLFLVSCQYSDLATIGGISQFSGGCIYHFPLFRKSDPDTNERLVRALRRYLTRKIGFEAVMRVRCSRGLAIHTFHGNFFVRSTDLLSLPNVNPDAGFGMQVAIEDSLCELQTVCFQAAVLYTSAKGERRIRVHTLCLPVSSNLSDILTSADQQAIVGLLGKMAVDRSLKSSLSDAREAFINVAIDILSSYKLVETSGGPNAVLTPVNLSLIPLYILALLKSTAFRTGQSTRLDDRVFAMSQMKTLPLRDLIQLIHPDLYNVTELDDQTDVEFEDKTVAQPPRLSLSSEHLDSRKALLLDTPYVIYLLVGRNISKDFLRNIFDVSDTSQINMNMVDLPEVETEESEKLRHFINYLQSEKAWPAIIKVITDPNIWQQFLVNDKAENALSYYELLHHVKAQLK